MRILLQLGLLTALGSAPAAAGTYMQQSAFNLPLASLAGMDSDSVGNLYVLGLPAGATTYAVAGYSTHGVTPLFSFDTGVSTPIAFAVEGSGVVNILNSSDTLTLKRFQNTGTFLGQASYPAGCNILRTAIDKTNARLYIACQYTYRPYYLACLGCAGPATVTRAYIHQYDFQGTLLRATYMPGADYTAGSCYTPTVMTADPQGNLYIGDAYCSQLLKYSPTGTLLSTTPSSRWTTNFQPRAMWTDPSSNLYISQPVCGPTGCPQGIVKLDPSSALETSFVSDSASGCAWDERILYLSSAGGAPLRRMVFNGAPTVPAPSGPLGMVVQHSSSALLNWQSSNDPDSDPVAYSIFLGTIATQLPPIGTASENILTSQPLAFGTTYYWQAVAADSYLGLPLQATPSPVVSFNLNLVNAPPNNFAVVRGTGTVVTRATTVTLGWQAAGDSDGDPVLYDLLWRPGSQAPATVAATTSQTSLQMSGLAFGTTYYWSVRARDGYNAFRLMAGGVEQPYYQIFQNSPPATPSYPASPATYALHTASPAIALSWAPSDDPDGDAVNHRFELSAAGQSWALDLGTSTSLTVAAVFETTYSWRVSAVDAYGAVSTGLWRSFIVHLANQAPAPIVYASAGSLITRATSYALAWQDTGDPDGDSYAYAIYLSTDPGNLVAVQAGLRTSYTLGFQYGTTYYWQVAATDSFGATTFGAVRSFLALFKNASPGMPTIFSGSGTNFQHTLIPAASLAWSAVGDADGDPTAYRLAVGGSPQSMSVVQDGPLTSYALPSPQLGTTYYWQVSAYDPYGGVATTPVQLLLIQLQNGVPTAPAALTGAGLLSTRNTSQALSWSAASDPDGDPVTYEFALSTSAAVLPIVQASTATSYPLSFQYGTTYYWQATARDGFGGVSATGPQSFLPHFRNSPPTVPANLSKTGTLSYHGWLPSQSIFWQDASDPDGDAFAYSVYFGTDSERLSLVGAAPLGYTVANLAVDTAYYYRIVATDIHGAMSASPLNWVYYQFSNSAPRAFDPTGPAGALVTRNANQSLSWTASSDADGDLVTYRVYGGTSSGSLAPMTDTTQLAAQWPGLAFGATYYWRVDAYDGFGATTAASGGTQSFGLTFRNSAPAAPGYATTAAVREFHTMFPEIDLSWSLSPDADGDAVSYRLDIGPSTGTWETHSLGASTLFSLTPLFDTTYYWRVTAADPYGGSATGPWASVLARFVNRAPAVPSVLTGVGVSRQHTLTPSVVLSWSAAADPDGDPTAYRLAVGGSPQSLSIVQDGPPTSYALPSPQLGTTYYWQVSAYDPYGGAAFTTVQTLLVELQNSAPAAPGPLAGTGLLSTRSTSQLVSWSAGNDPDGDAVTYEFALSTNAAALPIVQSSTATSYALSFQYGTTYYWQVSARDGFGGVSATGLQTLLPVFRNAPPTVPANLSKTGTLAYHGWLPSQSIFWQDAADPDGDAFTYSIRFGTDSERLSLIPSPPLGYTVPNLAVNTAYYYRILATDIYGAVSASPLNWVYYQFQNAAPLPFDPIGPTGPLVTRDANQTLSWTASSDPDGDLVTYRVYAGTMPGSLAQLADTTQASAQWSGLAFGATYYWRVDAYDAFGATTAASGGTRSFGLAFRNAAPAAPGYASAPAVHEFHTATPELALSWSPAADADGDAVSYRLEVGPSTGAWQAFGLGAATSFRLEPVFDATYYWRITAVDPYGGATAGPWASFVARFVNRPPAVPSVSGGAGVSRQHTLTPSAAMSWSAAADPDGDLTSYRLAVGASPQSLAIVQDGPLTSYSLPSPQLGTTYYWQVAAYDAYGGLASTAVQSLLVELQNGAPSAPGPLTGTGLLSTRGASQVLSWSVAQDPDGDPVSYEFALSTTATAFPVVQTSTATAFLLTFQYGTTYYWQATARDSFGGASATGVQTFLPVFRNSAPLVPANLSKTGTIPYHGWSPAQALFWQDAADPDGDAFTYGIQFGTDSERMAQLSPAPLGQTFPNLAVNTAYFYRIVATDIYGAVSASPLNWVYYEFQNAAPRPFDPIGPASTVVTRDANRTLSWTASSDPDGDLVTYRVYVGTAPGALAPLSDTTLTSVPWAGLAFGSTYYWRVDAHDNFGATTSVSGGAQSFGLEFRNSAPAALVYASTAAVHPFHTLSPELTLSWSSAADPDGDAVSYRFDLGASTGSWQTVGLGASTAFTLEPHFETTYYWRVTASDPHGGIAVGAWSSFLARFVNRPPAVPGIVSGAGVSRQHTLTPSVDFSWSPVADPEGDPVAYRLYLGTSPVSLAQVQAGNQASYPLPQPQFGTTYYWQVSALDAYGASAATPVQSLFLSLDNTPPAAFPVLTGTGPLSTRATSQLLSWKPSEDADRDPVSYGLFLSTDPGVPALVQLSTATSLPLAFQYGTTYYWRVDAYDGFGGTTAALGGLQAFFPTFLNDPPSPLELISPFKGSPVVSTMRDQVALSWERVTTPQGDPVDYTVYLGGSPNALEVLTRIRQTEGASGLRVAGLANLSRPQSDVGLDGDTIKLRITRLDYYKTYYLRIVASNPYGASSQTPLQAFSLGAANGFPKAYNYPNPFSPSRGGTRIVFNAPPSGYARATVSIYSELQDLLFEKEYANIPPGVSEVGFDGRDRNGRPFFNGSYLCRVRYSGPDDKEIFYLLVVK